MLLCGFSACRQAADRGAETGGSIQTSTGAAAATAVKENLKTWSFEDAAADLLPPYISAAAGSWSIQTVEDAPSGVKVLVQRSKGSGDFFNLAFVKDSSYKNLELSVRLKALAGGEEQGGGVLWRYQDSRNYYIARANPLEDNLCLYKVVRGKRKLLKSAQLNILPGWHELQIQMRGRRIECLFDGKTLLEAQDSTFPEAGRVGLWTKADAQTAFDDLAAATLP
ncbi:MAG: hypothetical protein A3G41_01975 [Elusimicrobia bacterium RIFCSPLOWO2_12_FULL_59_9]|nr:MAG: hypothetical protein A3G41_01975 [Elusimicrobia bacterium RIFCSPLOWO2_12_FULL_59_9]